MTTEFAQSESDISTHQSIDLSTVVIHLLKGVIYNDTDSILWSGLLKLQSKVRDHVRVLGLELIVDEAEGYAFLRSMPDDPDGESYNLPRLVPRRPLSFAVSLMIALLRKKLLEFDSKGGDTRLVLAKEEIVEMLRVFLPTSSNEARIMDQVDSNISKVVDLGFLRQLKSQTSKQESFEVKRIIKAFVDAQWLHEFDERLAEYQHRLKDVKDNEI